MSQSRAVSKPTDRFERKREAVLDAATPILNDKGVKGLTLSDTAAAVGLSTTSVTYYFRRKDDLAAASITRGIETLHVLAQTAIQAATPPERLRLFLSLYLDVVRAILSGQASPLPAISELRALSSPRREEVAAAYGRLFRTTRQIFEHPELAWMSRGRRTARTRVLLEQVFWGNGWLVHREPADAARIGEAMADILLNGMAAPGATWAPTGLAIRPHAAKLSADRARDTFLLAATRLINLRGYRGASVDKISAELNVTKGSFYHHNDAKDDLVVACFQRTFEVMDRALSLAAGKPIAAWGQLSACASALAEFQLSEDGPLLRRSALTALPPTMRGAMEDQSNSITARIAAMISAGVADGSLRPLDPSIAAQMLNATLNACADLGDLVPDVRPKAAAAVFVKPLMMGIFER